MGRWFHSFLTTTLQRKFCLNLTDKKTKAWEGKAIELISGFSPLDDGFVIQLPSRGLHNGKLLPCHLAQRGVLHRGADGADELRENPIWRQDGQGAHGVHGRLSNTDIVSVHQGWHRREVPPASMPPAMDSFFLTLLVLSECCPQKQIAVACANLLSKHL